MAASEAASTPVGELFEAGRRYRRATGTRHVFRLPADWMTIAFLVESGAPLTAYPRYVMRSTDGAYEKELTAKDDLVQGDGWLELRFEHLLPGKRYTLTIHHDEHVREALFTDVELMAIVDQPRPMHALIDEHAYAVPKMELGPMVSVDDWRAERAKGRIS